MSSYTTKFKLKSKKPFFLKNGVTPEEVSFEYTLVTHFTTGDAASALMERERFNWQTEILNAFNAQFSLQAKLRGKRFCEYAGQRLREYLVPENIEFTREDLALDEAISHDEQNDIGVRNYTAVSTLNDLLYREYMTPLANKA